MRYPGTIPINEKLERLVAALAPLLGDLPDQGVHDIASRLEWVEIEGGQRLIAQGDEGDCAYFLISGRLQAVVTTPSGEKVVGEISRGETVGELALLTGGPRTASIYAMRDSVLGRLSQEACRELFHRYPDFLLRLTKLVLRRSGRAHRPAHLSQGHVSQVRSIGIIYHGARVDRARFIRQFRKALELHGATLCTPHGTSSLNNPGHSDRSFAAWDDEQETQHRFVVLETDPSNEQWNRRCLRQVDRVLIVANFADDAAPGPIEAGALNDESPIGRVHRELVLLHPNGDVRPSGTRRWLDARQVEEHYHVRLDRDGDFERLARVMAGTSTGYVCSGGGALGFAHIGVLRALDEANIKIDFVGGTSMGAVTAASVAMDWDYERLVSENRQAFTHGNPLSDYQPFPFVSVFKGRRIERRLQRHFGQIHIEDLWLPFYCVSANLTRAEVHVHRRGLLWRALRATVSIPGVVPPVVFGDELHVDGGAIDNLPIAAMRDSGAHRIVASHVEFANAKLAASELHTGFQFLREKLLRKENGMVPGLVDIVMHSTGLGRLANMAALAAEIDLFVQTPLRGVGMLDWKKFDQVIEAGYREACDVLAKRDGLRPLGR